MAFAEDGLKRKRLMNDEQKETQTADGQTSTLTDGLGCLEAYKIFGNVQAQLKATGQADLAGILEKAITLIKSDVIAATYFLSAAQIITSSGCDFENKNWSFEIDEQTKVSAGKYAVIKLPPNAKVTRP